jgi:hypothetical protein
VELLIKKYPELIEYTNGKMVSAAGKAFSMGRVEIMKFLLKSGARVTSEANVRKNILTCSINRWTTDETVEELINFCKDNNPNVEEVCRYGNSRMF